MDPAALAALARVPVADVDLADVVDGHVMWYRGRMDPAALAALARVPVADVDLADVVDYMARLTGIDGELPLASAPGRLRDDVPIDSGLAAREYPVPRTRR